MEKDDHLEQFVRANKASLDMEEPRPAVWRKIRKNLSLRESSSISYVWKVAAVFFFCISILFTVDKFGTSSGLSQTNKGNEFQKVEEYYMDEIEQKMILIHNVSGSDFSRDPGSEQDLQKLDAMYQVLKEEYELNPSSKITDALILNLLIRVDILNNELYQVELKKELSDTVDIRI